MLTNSLYSRRILQFGMGRVRITISKENYLKAIAEAEGEGETVIAATLARWLKVSAPAVTMAIRRLKRDGLIHVSAAGDPSRSENQAAKSPTGSSSAII